MKKVVVIQRYIPQYRIRFFELLKSSLANRNINLLVIYGQPGLKDELKKDAVDFAHGVYKRNMIISIGKYEIYWQPVLQLIKNADLVIVEQASKLLINYILILQNILKLRKVAFWGHGKNFQSESANLFGELIKKILSGKVHWWFAYNTLSARTVENLGFPKERITVVQNSIDIHPLIEAFNHLDPAIVENVRQNLGIQGKHTGLYVGGMYTEKRLDFLLDACQLIRQRVPDFEMIFIGSGLEVYKVQEASRKYSWIHYVGPKFGIERVPYFALSQVFLMPGLVGLAILDCFAMEVPLITTRHSNHSPEIEYLINGMNGIMVDDSDDPEAYASEVISVLIDEQKRQSLVEGCRKSRINYGIEAMVDRFVNGIVKALE